MTSQRYKKYDRGLFYKGSSYKTVTVYNVAVVGRLVAGGFACALQWIPSGQFDSSSKEVCIVHDLVKKKKAFASYLALRHYAAVLAKKLSPIPRICQLRSATRGLQIDRFATERFTLS